jgi:hypothetical protein
MKHHGMFSKLFADMIRSGEMIQFEKPHRERIGYHDMKFELDWKHIFSEGFYVQACMVSQPFIRFEHERAGSLSVIISEAVRDDGNSWLHFSANRDDRIIEWRELVKLKDTFLGNVYAYFTLPPKEKYVNLTKNCLHLFHCVDHPQYLPEFSGEVAGINSI